LRARARGAGREENERSGDGGEGSGARVRAESPHEASVQRTERDIERESSAMCYIATMRPGKTKTTSFSLDEATLRNLRALAARRHKGNVSAFLAEVAGREAKFLAAEAYFTKYGVPPLSEEAIERIESEWRGSGHGRKARRRAA
jgi:hypothetical protein